MRLEACDRKNPGLTCVATIAAINGPPEEPLVLIHFDGWTDFFDYWAPLNSSDLYPVGHCEASPHNTLTLQPPKGHPTSSGAFVWDAYLRSANAHPVPYFLLTGCGDGVRTGHSRLPAAPAYTDLLPSTPSTPSTLSIPSTPSTPQCAICMDAPATEVSVAPMEEEQWEGKQLCKDKHTFCSECLSSWVKAHHSEQKAHIKCPHPGCNVPMLQSDVSRICPDAHEEHVRLLSRDFAARAAEIADDPELASWMRDNNAQQCPECALWVERSDGCAHMVCMCGAQFCYGCGCNIDECDCELCEYCEVPLNECECSHCEYCDQHEEACECSHCDYCDEHEEACECSRCDYCDEHEDECECSRCEHCTQHEDECECSRCEHCTQHEDECECSRCEQCDTALTGTENVDPACGCTICDDCEDCGCHGLSFWFDTVFGDGDGVTNNINTMPTTATTTAASAATDDDKTAEQSAITMTESTTTATTKVAVGMRLEACDRKNPGLTCVATIAAIKGASPACLRLFSCDAAMAIQVLIHFDGWTDNYDYWAPLNSSDLYPVGHCATIPGGCTLQAPDDHSGSFEWASYLLDVRAEPVPHALLTRDGDGVRPRAQTPFTERPGMMDGLTMQPILQPTPTPAPSTTTLEATLHS